jgi:site-specific DNA-methyltransferase (cytosine-N4-specific)
MKNGDLTLHLHDYTFFPYERDLAERELAALVGTQFTSEERCFRVQPTWDDTNLWRLTYFARFENGHGSCDTLQRTLEASHHATRGRNYRRQSTRYSVHGLHEYKGKFNPQLAHALLNIFGADQRHRILDPFCGSGTTLVEAAHLGIAGTGFDMNPLAVFVANAKLAALWTDVSRLRTDFRKVTRALGRRKVAEKPKGSRHAYLAKWFTPKILLDIERLRVAISYVRKPSTSFFLTVASDLLRDWSLQDPGDLRIRRRRSPLPVMPFVDAWSAAVKERLDVIEAVQPLLRAPRCSSVARLADSRDAESTSEFSDKFNFVITSPPYATALPYIDTQRLSLVWLGLIRPDEIRKLEAGVLGSREVICKGPQLGIAVDENSAGLPDDVLKFCRKLARSVGESDGFRRQAVPVLLYRYLAGMKATFSNLYNLVQKGGRMAWVVGVNQTTLGGKLTVVDTPKLLSEIAAQAGFRAEEPITLQTYQRYGVHQKNSIRQESVLIFRR